NINNFGGTVNISGGTFTGEYSAVYVSSGETTITGGTFSSDPSEYVASGYAATANEDGTYTGAAKAQ
ncbi:MAG: hypothetical protein IJW21_08125, partial [Clostridia bacterium]|nr:hypothetical protein [Clostridia bacterium]